mmetsp:Transcript_18871/g.56067  ORF Transcript_18871/g.56067 Transcript_18871/m.56067 type:complete len:342 (-) Transcript_18871:58-1083(-)
MARRRRLHGLILTSLAAVARVSAKGKRGHDAFWIMDPSDQQCLTTYGTLGPCDGDAMWVYVPRKGKDKWSLASVMAPESRSMCLVRKGAAAAGGSCGSKGAQKWEVVRDRQHFAITEDRQKSCLVRDSQLWSHRAQLQAAMRAGKSIQKGHDAATLVKRVPAKVAHNTVSLHKCKNGHTTFELHTSNVHEHGFMLASADTHCFDGASFRPCSDEDAHLRWGFGVSFDWLTGAPKTQLYKFYNSTACLVAGRDGGATLGPCDKKEANGWGLRGGRLSRGGDGLRSGTCLTRTLDGTGALAKCRDGMFEHLTLTLDSDGSDILQAALDKVAEIDKKAAAKGSA